MKKKLQKLFDISCVIAGLYFGYLLSQHIFSIFVEGEGLFLWIALVCILIWFGRHNKDGFYRLFKDIHQSNLDDIERQEFENPVEQTVVKEQIKTSLETVASFWLILYFLMCGILFIFVSDLGLVNWLILLSVIPIILILGFLKDKLISIIKNMRQKNLDEIEANEAAIIK